jgi:hypothetical protein
MANSHLYNGQNLDFTGNKNPYGLIQNAGKRRIRRKRRTLRRKTRQTRKTTKTRKTRKTRK